ncbi:MAG TPA: hypothetical protein VHS99_18495 [Chloroflexota bacterium]|nr:hypothetical protein [Chloroflexota bacterium]
MTEVLALSWRVYPAAALVILGVGLAASGLWLMRAGRRTPPGPERALVYRYLTVFRRVVVGLALAGTGVGWAWQVPWLFAAMLCVGAGELLESSSYLWVLRWGQRRGQAQNQGMPAAAGI